MRTDLTNPADVEHRLWEELEDHKVGMLGVFGAEPHPSQPRHAQPRHAQPRHAQPMTAFAERGRRQLWFYTRTDTDLARQVAGGARGLFILQLRDLQASICGQMHIQHDPVRIERYWNAIVSAWHPGGRTDPKLTLLCLDCEDAQVWISESAPVRFAWEIAKANATRHEPVLGGRTHLDFH
ncbi:MAG TPA: pyridoxamine 5'-phosphate oxidase family protein [Caulobacteraceae bacterium]|nr:pyridoxamine 5'-phosphate oxidase family protein [Caulobacteraceae bacterium]